MASDLSAWQAWLTAIEREYDEAIQEHESAEAMAANLGDGEGHRASPGWSKAAAREALAREHAVMAYTRYRAALVAYCARVDYEGWVTSRPNGSALAA